MPSKTINFRADDGVLYEIERLKEQRGQNTSEVMRDAIWALHVMVSVDVDIALGSTLEDASRKLDEAKLAIEWVASSLSQEC